ncbi:SLC5 family protein [Opitutaceae bacterium EW11]|nr:SLC5 family protein [Opitutaceae bacterium EW11]
MSSAAVFQIVIFIVLIGSVALATWLHCRKAKHSSSDTKEYFLANSGLNWILIAGSITLTNINTDTMVGWNGNQMLLITWWEFSAVVGLLLLAKVFVPIYYRYKCTTVTELLERRYDNKHIRGTVATIFLLGDVLIFLPIMLYTSSLLIKTMLGLPFPLVAIGTFTAAIGASYAILGGLRAVAFCDSYNGIIVLGMAMFVTVLSLNAVHWDFSGIPQERLTMIGGSDSLLPWPALLIGMIYSQLYYWSTNQTITQRALAAPSIREAQKGVYAAAAIRLLIIPPIIAIPGICAFKLYGKLGDQTYGHIVHELLPTWLLGAFAAAMFGAVISSYTATLNSSATLYVCDIHQRYFNPTDKIKRFSTGLQILFAAVSILLIPVYMQSESIIQLIQKLIGLFSMPILAAFITGLLFRNVDARAVIGTIVFGAVLYGLMIFAWPPIHAAHPSIPAPPHFLYLMAATVWSCVGFALAVNRLVFRQRASFELATRAAWRNALGMMKG